ncbi:MAG: metal-binding protein [Polynucleobacter sp. 17-46-58]|nr:MAG: metal-binding protein [Polynucleobacter sp. 17-46-58]
MKQINQHRRLISLGLVLLPTLSFAATEKPVITMWKSPTCGCCKDWADHVEKNGFSVKTYTDGNDEIRKKLGMPIQFGSCHLLAEKPKAVGLAVPAMPVGSPGMDGPEYKGRKDSYDVLLIGVNGKPSVYQSYR